MQRSTFRRSRSQNQQYSDSYEDDSYPEDEPFHTDPRSHPPVGPVFPARHRQYGALGRKPAPSHRRSTSMNPPSRASTQPAGRRSRSSQRSTSYDIADDDATIRMSDMEAMFQRLSMEREERHRRQAAALEERHRQQTEGLQKRLEALEARPRPSPSESSRGGVANRGGVTQAKRRSQRYIQRGLPPPEAIAPELDAAAAQAATVLAALEEDEEVLGDDEGEPEERPTGGKTGVSDKTAHQRCSTQTFRGACGIKGKNWPGPAAVRTNPTTGVPYLTPLFNRDVDDPQNHSVCLAVAKVVDTQLKGKRSESISDNAVWDDHTLLECAKNSFPNLKQTWKRGQSVEAEEQGATNDRNTRMYRRRERVSAAPQSIVIPSRRSVFTEVPKIEERIEAYAEKYRIPVHVVRELVHEELLSDEASGPEDKTIESPAAWKVRMAVRYGEKDVSPAALNDQSFLEVLECPWRSDELSEFSRRIQQLPGKSGNIQYKRVRGTHRKSSRIPLLSPYDFGISREWLEEQRQNPEAAPLLTDWGIHGNPKDFEGIGLEVGPTDAAAAAGERVVDPRFDFEGLADRDDS
ncbi:hypothetical protein B0H10DRAFT_2434760 [Mycena sp. CBHHK59/15]|nr:hypothetical protein B0H10DRAFT_2434760 [Mycena sp. CBHHK59/15]